MSKTIYAGKIFGIEIHIDFLWFILFGLITFSLFGIFRAAGESLVVRISFSFVTSCLFFGTLFCHEIAHCLAGKYYGLTAEKIALLIFGMGGVLNFDELFRKGPAVEFKIALAGPLVNLFWAGIFFLLRNFWISDYSLFTKIGLANPGVYYRIALMFSVLSSWNMVIAGFNFLPIFPMDGGRIFRSICWWRKKDLLRATYIADVVGRVMLPLIFFTLWFFTSRSLFSALWLFIIGSFILKAGRLEYECVNKLKEEGKL